MASIHLRERARVLRKRGASIAEIARKLPASKSTVSYWCRDIALSNKQIQHLAERQTEGGARGRLHAAEQKRAVRLKATEQEFARGARLVGPLRERDIFVLGTALYWGEGYKSGNDECGLTNSNPDIIRAFILWLKLAYDVPSSALILRVSINNLHRTRIRAVENYWSTITGIPRSQFTKTSLIQAYSRKIYANPENHYGTLRIKVRRGTALRRRIMGSITEISKQIHSMK